MRIISSNVALFLVAVTFIASICEADNAELVGQWDGFGGSYADVWGDGDFAFVAHFGHAGISIVDISDPANPVGFEYSIPPPNGGASAQDVKVWNGMMFVALEGNSQGSVHIADVRDPSQPSEVVNVVISGMTHIHNVFIDQGFLYLADSGTPRVAIVDIRDLDPDNPPGSPITEVFWMVDNIGTSFVHDITVQGGRMYASGWDSGLFIYDVTNVANEIPSFLGQTPDGGNNTHSCWPTDKGDFVVTGEERDGGGVKVYRITDNGGSLTLELTDSFAFAEGSTHNQVIVGYRLYNSWYSSGLQVFDIDPVTGLLQFVASYDTSSAWGVYPFLGPSKVLVSDINDGLYILSVDAASSTIMPDELTVFRGFQIGGDITDVFESDDSYLKFNPGITLSPTEPPVWIEFEGTLISDSPTSLTVMLEASANTVGITQTIEMFNWNSGQYEEVDSKLASLNSDSVVSVDLTANISDYVESGTGAVKTRTGWRATGIVSVFPWTICIDQVVWMVTD